MHRSGTSCLAGMLAAAGVASAGEAIRNWDNARGHFEMLEVVRLDEAVLATSGGHWLSPPPAVTWTDAQAAARDAILRAEIDGKPALLKDPRALLVLPFWRASRVPVRTLGIVRHPLAVARSQQSWRGMPLAEGVALWLAHNRVLAADQAQHGYPLIDFEQTKADVVAAVRAALEGPVDEAALAAAYEEQLVHHDDGDAPDVPGLSEAVALYAALTARGRATRKVMRRAFPRAALAAVAAALARAAPDDAITHAHLALAGVADLAAVIVPLVTTFVKARAYPEASTLVTAVSSRLDPGLADLLHGKILLARGDAPAAVRHLEAACAVPQPFHQARHLLPQALRSAHRLAEARAMLAQLAHEALYPHGPLATLAEWDFLDGALPAAIETMARAIAAAPPHRRGRLRTRRAEWLLAREDVVAARAELMAAIAEDPGYPRSREVLARIDQRAPTSRDSTA